MIEKIIQDKVGRLVIVNKLRPCKNENIYSLLPFFGIFYVVSKCCFNN